MSTASTERYSDISTDSYIIDKAPIECSKGLRSRRDRDRCSVKQSTIHMPLNPGATLRIVDSRPFHLSMNLAIVLSAIVMGFGVEFRQEPAIEFIWIAFDHIFAFTFSVECVFRLLAHGIE